MKKTLYLLFVIVLAGCSGSKQKGMVYFNDFENIKGWTDLLLDKKPVHSGIYSNRLDSVHPYSESFKLTFNEISEHAVQKVKISIWVHIPDPSVKGKLVMEVNQPDKTMAFWIGKDLDKYVYTYGEWTEIKEEFTFVKREILQPQNVVKIFLWDLGKKEMHVDDMRIEFVL